MTEYFDQATQRRGTIVNGNLSLTEEGVISEPDEGAYECVRFNQYGRLAGFVVEFPQPLPNVDANDPWYLEWRVRSKSGRNANELTGHRITARYTELGA